MWIVCENLNTPFKIISIRIESYNEKLWLYAKNEKFSLNYIVIFHNKPFFVIWFILLSLLYNLHQLYEYLGLFTWDMQMDCSRKVENCCIGWLIFLLEHLSWTCYWFGQSNTSGEDKTTRILSKGNCAWKLILQASLGQMLSYLWNLF